MKKLRLSLLFALTIFGAAFSSVQAQLSEQINLFDSQITINKDTSLTITEKIDYQTELDKHGIYRYIPISYNRDGTKAILRISQIKITDEKGKAIPFSQSSDGQFFTLKIGDPDHTFTGQKEYLLTYAVEKGINRFDTHDELYWDITGEGWRVPILHSKATISSPYAAVEKIDCFTGVIGGNDKLCQKKIDAKDRTTFTYDQQITYGENFTVVVSLDKNNQLVFPSQYQNLMSWIRYNWQLFLIPFPLLIMFVWWFKKGRDYEFVSANIFDLDEHQPAQLKSLRLTSRVPYVYAPLEDLSPGEAGAVLHEKVSTQDVVSEILELARKKYLKLELIEKKKFLGTDRDYQMTKLKGGRKPLTEVQQYLLDELFKDGDVVTVSGLKGKFYTKMGKASEKIEQSLMAKKLFTSKPTNARIMGIGGFIALIGVTYWIVGMATTPLGIFWPILALAVQIPAGLWLGYNLPQKTAIGNNLWMQARGLKKSIEYGKWREQIKEKNLFIEEVLPFAVALGVVQQLSKQMEELNLTPPDYVRAAGMSTWNTQQFVSGFSNEVGSSLSYNPSSSSSSGGSGFGGSSGGGGGGGGGGSW
jgi:hypothetical protein